MEPCTHPDGHLWSPQWGPTKVHFNGVTSSMVVCTRDACEEIGYRIQELAQNSRQSVSK